jgi:hypothetical protein
MEFDAAVRSFLMSLSFDAVIFRNQFQLPNPAGKAGGACTSAASKPG